MPDETNGRLTRQEAENTVIDAETLVDDLHRQIQQLLKEHREAAAAARQARARLDYLDYIECVECTFGPEIAAEVRRHSDAA